MSNIKKKILKIILDDKLYIFCLLSLLILFGLRIFNLDCDLPPFGIAYYQTIDEGLYSKISINLYKYNNLYTTGEFPLYIAPNYRANIVGNIFQYLTLKIFGNNYYGFRIPYVIMALISFLLIFMTVKEISIRYGLSIIKTRLFSIFFLMYVLIDFSYLLMSRCVENSNIRVLTIVLSIYLFIKLKSQYKYFMLSFIGIISIFFVYFSNIVILVGAGFLFIYAMIQKDWEKCKSIIIQYLGGILLGFIVTEIYYLLVWKEGALTNLISAVFDFSDRINVSQSTGLLKNMVKGVFLFLNSNMFFYSFSFLVVSLLALIFNLFYAIKKNDEIMLLVNIIIVLGIVQSVLTQDWMERKAIVYYPAIIINIFLFFLNLKKNSFYKTIFNYRFIKHFFICFFILMTINVYTMIRLHVNYSYFYDFQRIDFIIVILAILIQFFLNIYIIYMCFWKNKTIKRMCYTILFFMVGFVNLFFSFKYVYFNGSYLSRDTMKEIGKIVGDKYVAGPYAYGFSLYNDCKMISNKNEDTQNLVKEGYVEYILDYSTGPYYANQILSEESRELIYEQQYSVQTLGQYNKIGLYKKKELEEN